MPLTHERVDRLRRAGWSDYYFARIWGVHYNTAWRARKGRSWQAHPTPPDTAPRLSGGRYCGIKAQHPRDGALR